MKMLVDEVTEMSDYGYFVDIDNATLLPNNLIERSDNKNCVEKDKPVKIMNKSQFKPGLFYLNTFCCITFSLLFLKAWVLPSKQL